MKAQQHLLPAYTFIIAAALILGSVLAAFLVVFHVWEPPTIIAAWVARGSLVALLVGYVLGAAACVPR